MIRVFFIMALVALAGDATLLLSPPRPVCTESCPDDDAEGACTPTCACPVCCAHHAPMVVHHSVRERLPEVRPFPSVLSILLPPSAEPHDIFHIPKPRLA